MWFDPTALRGRRSVTEIRTVSKTDCTLKRYGVRHLLLPLIYGEQFQTEMDADWKSVSSVKYRMRFDTSTHRKSDSGLKRYFIWFENFAVNKIEPFESAFSLLNVLQIKFYKVSPARCSCRLNL